MKTVLTATLISVAVIPCAIAQLRGSAEQAYAALQQETEGLQLCLIPFDEGTEDDEEDVESASAEQQDPLLECNAQFTSSLKAAAASSTASVAADPYTIGWRVAAGTVRELRSPDRKIAFSVAEVVHLDGRTGTLISTKRGKGPWIRKVTENSELREFFQPRQESKFLGLDFGDILDEVKDLLAKIRDKLGAALAKAIAKLIDKLADIAKTYVAELLDVDASKMSFTVVNKLGKTHEHAITTYIDTAFKARNGLISERVGQALQAALDTAPKTARAINAAIVGLR